MRGSFSGTGPERRQLAANRISWVPWRLMRGSQNIVSIWVINECKLLCKSLSVLCKAILLRADHPTSLETSGCRKDGWNFDESMTPAAASRALLTRGCQDSGPGVRIWGKFVQCRVSPRRHGSEDRPGG